MDILKEIENFTIEQLKENEKESKKMEMENHIYAYYSKTKQSQDEKWVSSYSTKLKAMGVKDLENIVVEKATLFYQNKNLKEVLKDVPTEQMKYIEKLVKVAVRTQWVEDCIEEGLQAIEEEREAKFPKFPKFD